MTNETRSMMHLEYFTSIMCRPCKTFGPVLERVAAELGYEVIKIDCHTEHGKETAQWRGVRGTPTVIAFVGEMQVGSFMGVHTEEQVRQMLFNWKVEP